MAARRFSSPGGLPGFGSGSGSGKGISAGTGPTLLSGGGLPNFYERGQRPGQKTGPNRSSKASGKLKILPEEPEPAPATPSTTTGRQAEPDVQTPHVAPSEDVPEPPSDEEDRSDEGEEEEEENAVEVYKQLAHIPEGTMRRDAQRLTRRARAKLPRVTAYSTATSYRMRELTAWLQARRSTHETNPKTFDECVYTTYTYEHVDSQRHGRKQHGGRERRKESAGKGVLGGANVVIDTASTSAAAKTGDLLGVPELNDANIVRAEDAPKTGGEAAGEIQGAMGGGDGGSTSARSDLPSSGHQIVKATKPKRGRFQVDKALPEVFFMEYGTVVIWGMSESEERRLLRELKRFEVEKLAAEDVQCEDLTWYLAEYSRIYNDVITLRQGSSYMTKLSLSHALAQSAKISFFEAVIENTIETTKDIPQSIADSGKVGMPPQEIMKQIGHLFILRMNIHLVGSIVDSPEIFWAQPDLEPLYSAARSYLEIPQRIDLLNARVEVLQDMLQLLKDQVSSSHGEYLEMVVIYLIVLEIILGVTTIFVDLFFT